jgi:hypothetical protein
MSVPIPLRVDIDAVHPSGTRDSSRRSGPTFNTASAAATRLAATLACDLRATLRGRRITAGPRFPPCNIEYRSKYSILPTVRF